MVTIPFEDKINIKQNTYVLEVGNTDGTRNTQT